LIDRQSVNEVVVSSFQKERKKRKETITEKKKPNLNKK
jgi:hypothetical protein